VFNIANAQQSRTWLQCETSRLCPTNFTEKNLYVSNKGRGSGGIDPRIHNVGIRRR
jgi:hypothetical protein